MITMLATLCHLATVQAGQPPIEFCAETVVAYSEDDNQTVASCYSAAQQTIAPRLQDGYTVKQIRCAKGVEPPRNTI